WQRWGTRKAMAAGGRSYLPDSRLRRVQYRVEYVKKVEQREAHQGRVRAEGSRRRALLEGFGDDEPRGRPPPPRRCHGWAECRGDRLWRPHGCTFAMDERSVGRPLWSPRCRWTRRTMPCRATPVVGPVTAEPCLKTR